MSYNDLRPQQQRFVDEYIIDNNATQAAIRAKYSKKTAQMQGSRLLANAAIQVAMKEKQKNLSAKLEITAEKVLQEYAKIAFSNMGDFANWDNGAIAVIPASSLSKEQQACVAEITETTTQNGSNIKIKLHDKKGALDSLARHLGLFNDSLAVKMTLEKELELLSDDELKQQIAAANAITTTICADSGEEEAGEQQASSSIF